MTTQTFDLDMIPNGVAPIIHASQYDKGQTWIFSIFADSTPFSIPAGAAVTIQGTKPDHTGFQYACSFSGNQVTATEMQQMTVLPGDIPTEIRITKDDDIIGSINFKIRVEPAALADDTEISETDLALIEEAEEIIARVPQIIGQMDELKEESEAWAIGERGGVPVSSTDPTFENNARYYAEHFAGYIPDSMYNDIQTLLS